MFDPTKLLADALGEHLSAAYGGAFRSSEPRYAEVIDEAASLVVERISGSDALYHDVQHTALVTLVAQDILRGRLVRQAVSPEDWLHTILAALTHDLGYVRGVCRGDQAGRYVIDV